jgi:hypothetical protein
MTWQLQDLKARQEEIFNRARTVGPQIVADGSGGEFTIAFTGQAEASAEQRPSFLEYLLSDPPWDDEFCELLESFRKERK